MFPQRYSTDGNKWQLQENKLHSLLIFSIVISANMFSPPHPFLPLPCAWVSRWHGRFFSGCHNQSILMLLNRRVSASQPRELFPTSLTRLPSSRWDGCATPPREWVETEAGLLIQYFWWQRVMAFGRGTKMLYIPQFMGRPHKKMLLPKCHQCPLLRNMQPQSYLSHLGCHLHSRQRRQFTASCPCFALSHSLE